MMVVVDNAMVSQLLTSRVVEKLQASRLILLSQ